MNISGYERKEFNTLSPSLLFLNSEKFIMIVISHDKNCYTQRQNNG